MSEYERGFIDGIKSKVSAELTPTLINVSRTMLEMLKPVISTALENALNDNNAIPAADVQPVKRGKWETEDLLPKLWRVCSCCGYTAARNYKKFKYCPNCGARMDLNSVTHDRCSNYMDCDGSCFIDDTPCDCAGNIEKCKGR